VSWTTSAASSAAVVRPAHSASLQPARPRSTVYVNATPDLDGPTLTRVADGSSDVVDDLFGERGRHARATCGVAAPAFGVSTIVEATVGLR
jgi:hypothetical protein